MNHGLLSFEVNEVDRWLELNEYEGTVRGFLDGIDVSCYVLASPIAQWDVYAPGATLRVDAWLERSGDVDVLPIGIPSALEQIDGAMYEAIGVVTEVDGDECILQSVLRLRVDLDPPTQRSLPAIMAGNNLRIRGMLKVDLAERDEN